MEFQWNQKDAAGFSSRDILENADKYKAWVVESSLTKAVLEIMALLEAEEEDSTLNALPPAPEPVRAHHNLGKPKNR